MTVGLSPRWVTGSDPRAGRRTVTLSHTHAVTLSASLALSCLLTACGTAPDESKAPVGPLVDVGHGAAGQVVTKLLENGTRCEDERPLFPPTVPEELLKAADGSAVEGEEVTLCVIAGAEAAVVHYLDVQQGLDFEDAVRAAELPGVFAASWGLVSTSEDSAELVAQTMGVANRTTG